VPEPESRPDLTAAPLELTVVKGLVDAVSHLALGHVFVANMTGNVVFLAFAVAGAARKLASIGAMLGGAVAGVLLLAMNRALSDGR